MLQGASKRERVGGRGGVRAQGGREAGRVVAAGSRARRREGGRAATCTRLTPEEEEEAAAAVVVVVVEVQQRDSGRLGRVGQELRIDPSRAQRRSLALAAVAGGWAAP